MIFLNDNDKLSYSFLKKNAHKCYVLLSNGHVTDFNNVLWLPVATWTRTGKKDT